MHGHKQGVNTADPAITVCIDTKLLQMPVMTVITTYVQLLYVSQLNEDPLMRARQRAQEQFILDAEPCNDTEF